MNSHSHRLFSLFAACLATIMLTAAVSDSAMSAAGLSVGLIA
jgi:hypothetical protein